MSVTIKDVAKKAGVSFSTVSKVINKSPSISQATIDKVNNIMKELNYQPNITARNFARKSTRNILFVFKTEMNIAYNQPHLFEIMCGVQKSLSNKNYTMSFKTVEDDRAVIELLQRTIAEQSADGIVVHGSVVTKDVAHFLTIEGFPHIVIGQTDFASTISWIDTNNALAGQTAVDFLYNKGYKNIAFVGGNQYDCISAHRYEGVIASANLRELIIKEEFTKNGIATKEESFSLMNEILNEKELPNAVICANNVIALGVIKAISQKGLKIPSDIAVISFDDYPYSRITEPMLTIVDVDMFDMGFQAGLMIMRKIKNPALHIQTFTTLPILIEREST